MKSSKKVISKSLVLLACCMWMSNQLFSDSENEDTNSSRHLSIDLGNGTCKWQPPTYEIDEDIDFYKTMVVGYPSGDKRLTFVQMEALTGWAAKDEWDFEYLGMSNHPFIKANYPHHEGIWGWEDAGDQVVMVVRNMRRSMVEYHDILWDIGYAKTWEEATINLENLYRERPPIEDFWEWRDLRVMDEISWYGWFIDYWMEEGLMRDIFTHNLTTPEHWYMLMQPTVFSKDEVAYDKFFAPNATVTPSYDPHCADDVSNGCHPVQIISGERLVQPDTGPSEGRKIAMTLDKPGIAEHVIDQSTWECIWTELIINKKGLKTFIDREGIEERDYNFSVEMLEEMITELHRMIDKYNSGKWSTMQTANDLVGLLEEHCELIDLEIKELDAEIESGRRVLKDSDFLGPKTRRKRQIDKFAKEISERLDGDFSNEDMERHLAHKLKTEEKKDYSEFFAALDRKLLLNRKEKIKNEVFEEDMERRRRLRKHE